MLFYFSTDSLCEFYMNILKSWDFWGIFFLFNTLPENRTERDLRVPWAAFLAHHVSGEAKAARS